MVRPERISRLVTVREEVAAPTAEIMISVSRSLEEMTNVMDELLYLGYPLTNHNVEIE